VDEATEVRSGRAGEPGGAHHDGGASGPRPVPGRFYADVPNRFVAYLIDAVLLTLVAFAAAVVLSIIAGPIVTFDLTAAPHVSLNGGLALADAVLSTALGAVYFVGTWRRYEGSPGARLLGMRVVRADGGGRVGWGSGLVRWLFIGLPLALEALASLALGGRGDLVLILLLFAWYVALAVGIARDPMKRGWHDRVAGTVVTKVASVAPAASDEAERADGVR